MKYPSDHIGNQPRGQQAFSTVPQPTKPPRASLFYVYNAELYMDLIRSKG